MHEAVANYQIFVRNLRLPTCYLFTMNGVQYMTRHEKDILKEAARIRVVQQRLARLQNAPQAILDPATFPTRMPDIPENHQPNLIPREGHLTDVPFVVPTEWSGAQSPGPRPDILRVYLSLFPGQPVYERAFPKPVGNIFPLTESIDHDRLNVGLQEYDVYYTVTNGSGTVEESQHSAFTIDTVAPNEGSALVLPLGLNGVLFITPDVLNPNGLRVTVPHYSDQKVEDRIDVIMGTTSNPSTVVASVTVGPGAISLPTDVFIPAAAFLGLDDVTLYFTYRLTDRSENATGTAPVTEASLALKPAPDLTLFPPEVPLAEDDSLITFEDAGMPVEVLIPLYDNFQPGDRVTVTWDGLNIGAQQPNSDAEFKLIFPVPWVALENGDRGPKTVDVQYFVTRGLRPQFPSPVVAVDVDLRVPGTIPPGPGPNPDLPVVTVNGTGTPPSPDNNLLVPDKNLEVKVTMPLFDNPANGDEIQLWWNGVPVPSTSGGVIQLDGTESPGDAIIFTLPWSVAGAAEGPAIPVYYWISNPLLPGSQRSLTTDVNVATFELGHPNDPEFINANDDGSLISFTCAERAWEGLIVKVNPNSDFAPGDTVTILLTAEDGNSGTPITISPTEISVPLNDTEADVGFERTVPFSGVIRTAGENAAGGWAWLKVQVRLRKPGVPGEGLSNIVPVYINIRSAADCICTSASACRPAE